MIHRPQRFRRTRLLIVGCGDVGLRVVRRLANRCRVLATTSGGPERVARLREAGLTPLRADLDDMASLWRLGGLADMVLHLAPPPQQGDCDTRTARLIRALARGGCVRRLLYASTTGVYGDAGGAWIDETGPLRPASDRAMRRADAEARVRWFGRAFGVCANVLRIPGIYAADRPGGDPVERVRQGAPVLLPQDDVYTNHIHADDLARVCIAALTRGAPLRIYNASDDTELKMGDYFDLVADAAGLPRPPRISRAQAQAELSPLRLSFLSESRRLRNTRMKRELRVRLIYPTVQHALFDLGQRNPAVQCAGDMGNA
jgi:nucleoside-diphosphate-sugar epimerase